MRRFCNGRRHVDLLAGKPLTVKCRMGAKCVMVSESMGA